MTTGKSGSKLISDICVFSEVFSPLTNPKFDTIGARKTLVLRKGDYFEISVIEEAMEALGNCIAPGCDVSRMFG
jgi:hypothetical protein